MAVMYIIREKADHASGEAGSVPKWLPSLDTLDSLIYSAIAFAFLTLVLATGAIWAERAWGSYWRWDPKETCSLITWIIYAVYLHAHLVAGWKGHRSACMATAGFSAALITNFGVNLVMTSSHSYV